MTLFTTDYLEYYLTLVSWIVHNGIWAVLVSSGVFAIPFIAIIIQEWLKARTEGADEGNKGVLSSMRIENRVWVAIVVAVYRHRFEHHQIRPIAFHPMSGQCARTEQYRMEPILHHCQTPHLVGVYARAVAGDYRRVRRRHSLRHRLATNPHGHQRHPHRRPDSGTGSCRLHPRLLRPGARKIIHAAPGTR